MNKQEEIRFLLKSHGIKLSWIASRLDINYQTLTYLLNEPDKFDDDLYNTIKELINTYQYELGLFDEEHNPEPMELFDEYALKKGIGERIRIFAKKKYSTLKNLASAMGISPQQLQQYISGNREPGSRILIRFLRLGCDINWLLGGAESIESYKIYRLEKELRKLNTALLQIDGIVKEIYRTDHQ